MKARPRRAEREIAGLLSGFFIQYGLGPVERIPVLGREGPDISMNELSIAIDVKSRLSVPKMALADKDRFLFSEKNGETLLCCRLTTLFNHLIKPFSIVYTLEDPPETSKTVYEWYSHMAKWALYHDAIPALVLHRPRMPFANATFVIKWEHYINTKMKFHEEKL